MTTPIATGRREHYVDFERRTVSGRSADGSLEYVWQTLADRWVEIVQAKADEVAFGGQLVVDATHKMTFPYVPDLTTADRINMDGVIFHIASLDNRNYNNMEHVAMVKEVVDE